MNTSTQNNSLVNEYIGATINCVNGSALLHGNIVAETEKAVKIEFYIEPVFASGCAVNRPYEKTSWIPKSQVKAKQIEDTNCTMLEITRWFANNAMKSYRINK